MKPDHKIHMVDLAYVLSCAIHDAVAHYLKDPPRAKAILGAYGIACVDGVLVMSQRIPSKFIAMRQRTTATLLRGQILPDDFDDDTRIAEAVLRYHPPRAWVTC